MPRIRKAIKIKVSEFAEKHVRPNRRSIALFVYVLSLVLFINYLGDTPGKILEYAFYAAATFAFIYLIDRSRKGKNDTVRPSATPAEAIGRGSLFVLLALVMASGIIFPLFAGSLKVATGDPIPGIIMLLFAGFMLLVSAGWLIKRYQGPLVVLGISLLVAMGLVWTVFEDGYGPKAFMLSLVITAGFMAVLGFYNVFVRRRQPRVSG